MIESLKKLNNTLAKCFCNTITILAFMFIFINLFGCSANKNKHTNSISISENDLSYSIKNAKLVKDYPPDTTVDQMDTVTFGSYPQSDASGNRKEPIEWIVLDRDNENIKVLLLSKYILDCKCYNEEYKDVTWDTCMLRNWLNNDFYNKAFSSNEQNEIKITYVANNNNIDYGISGGNSTSDKIFLLSIEETRKYFGSGTKNKAGYQLDKRVATKGTEYAKAVDNGGYNLWVLDYNDWYGGNSVFWLRSPGCTQNYASSVNMYGYLSTNGNNVNICNNGVRPALWVSNLDSLINKSSDENVSSGINDNFQKQIESDKMVDKSIPTSSKDLSYSIQSAKLVKDYSADTTVDQMDTVTFGSYPQSNAGGSTKEPIEWIVVDRYVNKALLVSKNVIDCRSYNDEYKDVTWEDCSLRYWLNNSFYNTAFSDEEKDKISLTKNLNPNSGTYGTLGGDDTMDKVFILSLAEVSEYFGKDKYKLGAKATEYAKGVLNGGGHLYTTRSSKEWHYGNANYWLRSPGYSQSYVSHVSPDGNIAVVGETVDVESFGVRPAIWIKY